MLEITGTAFPPDVWRPPLVIVIVVPTVHTAVLSPQTIIAICTPVLNTLTFTYFHHCLFLIFVGGAAPSHFAIAVRRLWWSCHVAGMQSWNEIPIYKIREDVTNLRKRNDPVKTQNRYHLHKIISETYRGLRFPVQPFGSLFHWCKESLWGGVLLYIPNSWHQNVYFVISTSQHCDIK